MFCALSAASVEIRGDLRVAVMLGCLSLSVYWNIFFLLELFWCRDCFSSKVLLVLLVCDCLWGCSFVCRESVGGCNFFGFEFFLSLRVSFVFEGSLKWRCLCLCVLASFEVVCFVLLLLLVSNEFCPSLEWVSWLWMKGRGTLGQSCLTF